VYEFTEYRHLGYLSGLPGLVKSTDTKEALNC